MSDIINGTPTPEITPAQAKRRKTRNRAEVKIILDTEWGERLGALQIEMAQLRNQAERRPSDTSLLPDMDRVTGEIEAMMADAHQNILTVTFKSLPPDRYDRIARAHPPTQEQRRQAALDGRPMAFNPDTFPPALVVACWTSPTSWSEADIRELWEAGDEGHEDDDDAPAGAKWNSADLSDLFMGAQGACLSRNRVE